MKPNKRPNADPLIGRDASFGRDAVDDDARYEAWRHPTKSTPTESRTAYRDRGAVAGATQFGGARGVAEGLRRQDEPGTPTRVADYAAVPIEPGNPRRYRRAGQGFRVVSSEPARRPDPRIREDVVDILVDDAFVDAEDIEVKVDHGEVELCGYVYGDHERRRASELAARVAGVVHVVDHLTVGGPPGE